MSLTITIPERIEKELEAEWGDDLSKKAVEALAVEGYQSGILSLGEVAEMLGLSVYEADGFLKKRGVQAVDSLEEVEADSRVLEELLAK